MLIELVAATPPRSPPLVLDRAGNGSGWCPITYAFGPFEFQPERRHLTRGGERIALGGRACDILAALAARPGILLTKQELLELVWPRLFVEESNLKVNIASLRRALGECHTDPTYIATVVGRGYRFVSPVRMLTPELGA